ncbi:MAG: Short-chain dehydrogenase/reductase, partial [Blastococcus sp.]|nr:Short-chain dehydrogenase/reductase [Blastococcus sp.]
MEHYQFAGGSAVVTGAASGIGEALAVRLAARGSNLVLVDRDKERLTGVADRLRDAHPGLVVATHVADLA